MAIHFCVLPGYELILRNLDPSSSPATERKSFQANNVEVKETVLIGLHDIDRTNSSQDTVALLDKLHALFSRLDASGRAVVQARLRGCLADNLAATGHADSEARSFSTNDDAVIHGVDGGLPVVGLLAGSILENRPVPHSTDSLGARGRGHARCIAASLVGSDEGGDKRLPVVVGPDIGVGVGQDFLG